MAGDGYWLRRNGETSWVDGSPDEAAYVRTGSQQWYSHWAPAFLNQKVDVYEPAAQYIQRDLARLRALQREVKGRSWDLLSKLIQNGLEHVDAGLVEINHKEARNEAVAELLPWPSKSLYRVPYKSNDPDEAIRLSFLLHELTHVDADQRYRYHSDTARIRDYLCLNANGDEHDSNRDQKKIEQRLNELGGKHQELSACIEKLSEGVMKEHLLRRRDRAGVTYNEWDSVLTELTLYLYLRGVPFTSPVVKLVRTFASDAYQHRSQHPPRRNKRRPGGIN